MRRPDPVVASDPAALAAWTAEAKRHTVALHAVAMDAASRDRVFSRRELRKRTTRTYRSLMALLDAVGPEPAVAPSGTAPPAR